MFCQQLLGFLFRKDPIFVPEVAPDGEEAGRDKKADVRRDADGVQAVNDQVIEHEADALDKDVAADVLHLAEFQAIAGEGPVALDQVIERPADGVGDDFGGQPIPVKAGITDGENRVGGPEIQRAAGHILEELVEFIF
jgi:hypothetical protein